MQEDEMADATGSKLCTTDDVDRLQQTFYLDPAGRGFVSGRSPC